jgi:ubiquinone/menaquinone biosynthesis C-methylase UbiE
MRVKCHLAPQGGILLDAGSGPVQWPEYLTYSENYRYRLCADISITALKEARKRLGDKGLYVVADISNLPFKSDVFDGLVSLHAIHHLPRTEHRRTYGEFFRVLVSVARR